MKQFAVTCFFVLVLPYLWAVLGAHQAYAAWSPGTMLCRDHRGDNPKIASDGTGGVYLAWRVWGTSQGISDNIYIQRLLPDGTLAWRADVPVCEGWTSQLTNIAPDGLGGAIVSWYDVRNAIAEDTTLTDALTDVYAQRILPDGSIAPGWAVNGMPVATGPGEQVIDSTPSVVADGSGGAFFTWADLTAYNIFLQHLTTSGAVAPGWPVHGQPVCVLPSLQTGAQIISDGRGGVIVAWSDFRNGTVEVYAQRVSADGTIRWAQDGVRVKSGMALRDLIADSFGGFYAVSATHGRILDIDFALQRFTTDGQPAPGWPADGIVVATAPDERGGQVAVLDGAGGVMLAWYDYRDWMTFGGDIYMTRIQGDGSIAPGWVANGKVVGQSPADDYAPELAADGSGGAYVSWKHSGSMYPVGIFVQHMAGAGQAAAGWPQSGFQMAADSITQDFHKIISDDRGGAILSWYQCGPVDSQGICRPEIRAQRFVSDGLAPAQVWLLSASATSCHATLVWANGGALRDPIVERRTPQEDWQRLGGGPTAIAPDRMRYVDDAVVPGARYAYRLSWLESGMQRHGSESWVDVPAAVFALRGAVPNPVNATDLQVSFSLDQAGPARLELLDVSGRLVEAHDEPQLAAGDHLLRPFRRVLTPGVYWLRLRHGARSLTKAAVVVR